MDNSITDVTMDVFSAMQVGEPYKKYKKTILGKVYVEVLNPFTGKIEGLILFGNPAKSQPECFVEVWSAKEDAFFTRRNSKHFESGTLQEWHGKKLKKEKQYSDYTDEEIVKIVNSPFLSLQSVLNKADSEAFVYRILVAAQELEKSEKIIRVIEGRLSELQQVG